MPRSNEVVQTSVLLDAMLRVQHVAAYVESGVERSGPSAAGRGMSHEQIQEDWTKAPPLFP